MDGDLFEGDFVFPDDGGYIDVLWTIDGADPIKSCAALGAVGLEIGATHLDTGDLFVADFACEDGAATAPDDALGWPIGEYSLDIFLTDKADKPLSEATDIQAFIDFADHLSTDVGTIDFVP